MKAVIELSGSEFTKDAFDRITNLLANKSKARVRISIEEASIFPPKESKEEYFARLDKSIKQAEEGNVVTFTWEEFEAYSKNLLNEP